MYLVARDALGRTAATSVPVDLVIEMGGLG
jgi:hypothetical protein